MFEDYCRCPGCGSCGASTALPALRARLLYFYAAARFEAGQARTELSAPSLAKLLELEREPRSDDPAVAEAVDRLGDKLDAKWVGGKLVLSQPAKDADLDDAVRHVLEHWREVTGKTGCTLTAARRRLVGARLREGYSTAQLCDAASALALSPFHMGQNEQGVPYNDVRHFAGSAERLDRWLAVTPEGQARGAEDMMDKARREAEQRRSRRRRRTTT